MIELLKRTWRRFAEFRAGPSDNIHWSRAFDLDYLSGIETAAGVRVSHGTGLALPTYFACIRLVAEDISKLPLRVYQRLPGGGKRLAPEHRVYDILHLQPNLIHTSLIFRELLVWDLLARGNGFAEIQRDGLNQAVALHPIPASTVKVEQRQGRLAYKVLRTVNGTWSEVTIAQDNMIHVRGPGTSIIGYSIARLAAQSLGIALAGQEFAAAFYGNSGVVGSKLTFTKAQPSEESKRAVLETFERDHRSARNAHRPMVVYPGLEWEKMGVTAEEAQFVESREFNGEDICRWFRVPPHKVGYLRRATFSNIEHQALEYVDDTLTGVAVRLEQEFNRKLFSDRDHFCEHSFQALLRGDNASRAAFHKTMLEIGARSPNRILELENENPIEGGDAYYISTNLRTVEQAAADQPIPERRRSDGSAVAVFLDASDRMLTMERLLIERMGWKGEGTEAIQKFFAGHAKRMADCLLPLFSAYNGNREYISTFVEAQVEKAIADYSCGRPEDIFAQRRLLAPKWAGELAELVERR